MKSTPIAIGLVILGIVFFVVAALYAVGILQIFTSTGTGTHLKHAALFGVLGVASLVAANFARPKAA